MKRNYEENMGHVVEEAPKPAVCNRLKMEASAGILMKLSAVSYILKNYILDQTDRITLTRSNGEIQT